MVRPLQWSARALTGLLALGFASSLRKVDVASKYLSSVELYLDDDGLLPVGASLQFPLNQSTLPASDDFNNTAISNSVYKK